MEEKVKERLEQLAELRKKASLGGGEEKIAKQHKKGKLTARERIEKLIDTGTFEEFNMLSGHLMGNPGDGLVAGQGMIEGRPVFVYSQDATVQGGSIGLMHGYKMYKTVERAIESGVPFIGLHDSPGARMPKLEEGAVSALASAETVLSGGYAGERNGGSLFFPNTHASGVIPQIAAILGSCAGISVYSPALTDFVFMVDQTSHMFITGPMLVGLTMGEDITAEELGGAAVHCCISGVADLRTHNDAECMESIRELLSFLPANNSEEPPYVFTGDDPDRMLPESLFDELPLLEPNKPYDMHEIVSQIVDNGHFFEIKPEFAGEIITGFGRLDGKTVGIVANNPKVRAGALTVDSSDKQARFIRFCDAFNIPLVVLVDTPAYMPGSSQEHAGIIRHGAKVLYALCEATVPRIAVVIRKSYGGGNLGMGVLPGLGTDKVFFWPTVEMGVVGAEQSVMLFYREKLMQAEDPGKFMQEKLEHYRQTYANPLYEANHSFYIDDVINPFETRRKLIRELKFLAKKKRGSISARPRKHGNIPL